MSADPQPINPATAADTPKRHTFVLLALFLGLAMWFLWLHARHYDGDAIKNAVWNRSGPGIATVNHPYPGVWFWVWWKVGESFVATDFDSRMAWIEALNALLGAGAAALAASSLIAFGVRLPIAVGSALLMSLTHAWFYHSTQSTEPIMAQFWMMLSVRFLAAIPKHGVSAVIGSAAAWAIAVGAYQSYILGGLGLFWIICRERKHILPWLITAAIIGTSLYVIAAIGSGARDVRGVIGYITHKPDGEYWGFIRPSALLQLPFGLANALTPPWPVTRDWPGLRMGWAGLSGFEKGVTALIVGLTMLVAAAVAVLRVPGPAGRVKTGLVVVFLCGMFAPFYLLPYYNKLWLLPLGAFGLAAGLTANAYRRGGLILGILFVLVVGRNFQQTYFQRNRLDNPINRGAIALESTIGPKDLLISDGWDASNVYNVRNPGRPNFRLIYMKVSLENLNERMAEARKNGGKVYIFGLLEKTPEQFELSDVAKRGKRAWYPLIQSFKPKGKLVWEGKDKGVIGDLYEISEN